MSKLAPLVFLLIVSSFSLRAQVPPEENAPTVSEARLEDIPVVQDDRDSQIVLTNMLKKAGWLESVKINVSLGVVYISGKYKNKEHMTWLIKTAEKLPTILAVVNNATLVAPPVTDMGPYFREWNNLVMKVKKNSPKLLVGLTLVLFFLVLGSYLLKGFHLILRRRIKNPFLAATVAKVGFVPVWILFFYATLQILGMQNLATTIIGGTGVVGILFGLAFRGIAENYLSGFLLALRSPFTQGDHIKVNEYHGIVQNLNMRGTTIVDFDGNLILIPNTTVIQSVVQNYSANPDKRTSFLIEVSQRETFFVLQQRVLGILREIREVKAEPQPLVVIDQLGPGELMKVKVSFWFDAAKSSEAALKSAALARIKNSLSGSEDRSSKETDSDEETGAFNHEARLQRVVIESSLPVNSKSGNLLRN